ncbi:hypothetical protein NIIDNTM18_41980 [Mycolicibacterium litorale]|uniref:Uncharacterized protein n=1 Tax=Mycolicibacterium litorale TaxID=758802 RepID=A0A6S6PE48_9MYCO|nr:hypothetical protein [Mycolicibacterium litorale]BCI54920.1 hypothetical protein NIIDNTM18_41980 [Mycolicibacterium litorale]
MNAREMAAAAEEIGRRWPDADIQGHYGNASVSLEVVVDKIVVAQVNCRDGSVHELSTPISLPRGFYRIESPASAIRAYESAGKRVPHFTQEPGEKP